MSSEREQHKKTSVASRPDTPEGVLGSNAVRLSPRQCAFTGVLLLGVMIAAPPIWQGIEPLSDDRDFRIPYVLNEDYWLYSRYAQVAASEASSIPIIGDSVVWGQYVTPHETLSHALNQQIEGSRFANLGLNGSHPISLAGLIEYYGASIANHKVVLHYNPLWMSSMRRDLQTPKQTSFNHPQLAPQFFPRIPSYDAPIARRLGLAIDRLVPFLSWTAHLRLAYFKNQSIPSWTLDNPYANPFSSVTLRLPSDDGAASNPAPWTQKDSGLQSFEWVSPVDSLQWAFFKKSLSILRERDNDAFVLFGPFNEHMLTEESRTRYAALRAEMLRWLDANGVKYVAPDALPTEFYADASHPLAAGYAILAARLIEYEPFNAFIGADAAAKE